MKNSIIMAMLIMFCACSKDAEAEPQAPVTPEWGEETVSTICKTLVNPNATAEAQALYTRLRSVYGTKALSGVVADIDWNIREAENVHKWTGKWPVINVFDFINIHASKDVNPQGWLDYSDMSPVFQWHDAGGVVGMMWHWQVKANNGTNLTCSPGDKPGETSFDPAACENPLSADYKQMIHDIDQVAGYLKTMQRRGIPIIWRPLHEAAGNTYEYEGGKAWFWWGAKGPEVYKKLW